VESEVLLSSTITNHDYPSPPRVHWFVLTLVYWAFSALARNYAPKPYIELIISLGVDAWVFYLCLWLRHLEPESKSVFWGDASIIVELTYAATTISQKPSHALELSTNVLGTASAILGLITIYVIRHDLVKHYNEKENFNLQLGGVLTFFFSFIYFQYHLYDIAKSKKDEAAGRSLQAGKTLFK
jgi:hypothetical protein